MQVLSMNLETELPAHTVDGFHNGRFMLVQPKGIGHRSGIDAMLLASCVPSDFSGRLADLGAGAGAAGLAVASRCSACTVALVELDRLMLSCAQETIIHPSNQWLATRICVIESDMALTGKLRSASGLLDNHFDFVIMNPPFNLARDRVTPDPVKAKAHVMTDGMFEAWLRTAAAIVRPGGGVAIIARPQSVADIIAAMKGRFGALRIVPVQPRAREAAIRIIVTGTRASRAPLSFEPAIVLHGETGRDFLEQAGRLINGAAGLFE
jgi:tRNA1(Val) A37 N6-methylase TrmN6